MPVAAPVPWGLMLPTKMLFLPGVFPGGSGVRKMAVPPGLKPRPPINSTAFPVWFRIPARVKPTSGTPEQVNIGAILPAATVPRTAGMAFTNPPMAVPAGRCWHPRQPISRNRLTTSLIMSGISWWMFPIPSRTKCMPPRIVPFSAPPMADKTGSLC